METTVRVDDEGRICIETGFSLVYDTRMKPTVDDVIDSLHNLERLIKRTPVFIELKLKGAKISGTEVFVESVTEGSLRENLFVRFLISEKTAVKIEELVDSVREDTGMIKPMLLMGVGAMLYQGWTSATAPAAPSPQMQAYYQTNVINIGAESDVSGEQIAKIVAALPDKKGIAKEAVGVVQPIRKDPAGSILIGSAQAAAITPEVIAQIPESYEPPKQEAREKSYSNADIYIFASDRDKREQGWAGIVPELFERRIKFVLTESVNPDELHGHRHVKADIVVHERFNASKKAYEPTSVDVVAVAYK